MKHWPKRPAVVGLLVACALGGCGAGPAATPDPVVGAAPYDVAVAVDVATRYQVMQGFGASLAFYVDWVTRHPQRAQIYDAVFAGLNLQILRIGNWYQNTPGNGGFNDGVAVVQAARASLGHGPLVLISSWSPPAALKSTGQTKNGGTLAQAAAGGGYDYAGFGQWWATSLSAYIAAGAAPDFISIQNEPDFTASWESCLLDATESATHAGYDQALAAVSGALDAAGPSPRPRILGPETSGIGGTKLQGYLAALAAGPGLGQIDGIAHHLYNGGTAALPSSFNGGMTQLASAAAASDKPLFMTEYSPSSGAEMFSTAWLIHNAVTVEGLSAYLYWGLTWAPPGSGPPGGLVTTENPSGQATWTTPDGFTINDVYYAIRHFSKWIDTGWQRVAATASAGPIKASAFTSPDGQSVTVVLLNTDAAEHAVTVDGGGFAFASSAVYRTSGGDERTAALGPLAGAVIMPARALVTVTLGP